MLILFIFVQFFLSVILIGIILMQKGKGASMGVSFGAGASETVFGSRGTMPFLAKLTWVIGILFVVNTFLINKTLVSSSVKSVTTTNVIQKKPIKKVKKLPTLPVAPNKTSGTKTVK